MIVQDYRTLPASRRQGTNVRMALSGLLPKYLLYSSRGSVSPPDLAVIVGGIIRSTPKQSQRVLSVALMLTGLAVAAVALLADTINIGTGRDSAIADDRVDRRYSSSSSSVSRSLLAIRSQGGGNVSFQQDDD
ncbi:MAG: hypothetical protein M9953_03770 [Thermomicrobiales bacterium]|nr:hypothetical protein [Thermomicrobiales bacterium]